MPAKTDPIVQQPSLPGISPLRLAYDALLKEFPTPDSIQDAEKFFRSHTRAQITLNKDHDQFKVVLKQSSLEEDKEKHEYVTELDVYDKETRDKQYIDLAQKIHAMWLDVIAPKYQQQ